MDPSRAVLVNADSSAIADFTIQYKGTTISKNNVSVARIYIWNGGNAATHHAQILQPLKISLPPGSQIFEASIARESRQICGIELQRLEAPNAFGIDFNILEPKDGAAIQIIYGGAPDANFRIDGLIEGQDAIHYVVSNKVSKEEFLDPILAIRHRRFHVLLGFTLYLVGFFPILYRPFRYARLGMRTEAASTPNRWNYGWLVILSLALSIGGILLAVAGGSAFFSNIPASIGVGQ